MRKTTILTLSVAMLCALSSCKEEKKSNVIIAPKPVKEAPHGPTKLSNIEAEDTVTWLGRLYTVRVKRYAADSLDMVKDEQGHAYFDNLVHVSIVRPDGSEFFSRVFRKADFSSQLDEGMRRSGVLLGVRVDRAEGETLKLAASVGSPDLLSDEYVPLLINVSNHGAVAFERDTHPAVENVNPQGVITDDEDDDV